MLNIKPNKQ